MKGSKGNIVIKNKKASHDYEYLEKFIAGIVLSGTEIKSLRLGKATLSDSYCFFSDGELFIKGMHIAEYWWGNLNNHDPLRERKLLLTSHELRKIGRKIKESGLTIIVIKEYDKRETLKRKDASREMDRMRKV